MSIEQMVPHQDTIGSLIGRRVEGDTICLNFPPPDQSTTATGEPVVGFAMHLRCHMSMYIRAGGRGQVEREYSAYAAATCFVVLGSGEDDVRGALRGLMRSIQALQDLDLSDAEWESIMPEDVVPWLTDPEHWRQGYDVPEVGAGGAIHVAVGVVCTVHYSAARVLLTASRKIDIGVAEVADECSICFDALLGGDAVELPGCAHAFHRRCISRWFRRMPTCPLCRGDVVKHLDPELQKRIVAPWD